MDENAQELAAWKRETRDFLLQDASAAASAALKELERLDLLWGRIRFSRSATAAAIKADGHLVVLANVEVKLPSKSARSSAVLAALQQYCVLNQILEFHAVVQTQLGRLAALKGFLDSQEEELSSHNPQHADVDSYIEIVQATLHSLTRVCADLRNAANVLRLPSRRRFPYSSHVDHTFKTPLPPELVVDFSIHRGELLIEVFSVVASQKPPVAIPEGCSSKKEFAGCVCNLRGQRVEIVDYANIAIPIPQIEEMLSHLDAQVAWLVRVRDNTKALLDCHLA